MHIVHLFLYQGLEMILFPCSRQSYILYVNNTRQTSTDETKQRDGFYMIKNQIRFSSMYTILNVMIY